MSRRVRHLDQDKEVAMRLCQRVLAAGAAMFVVGVAMTAHWWNQTLTSGFFTGLAFGTCGVVACCVSAVAMPLSSRRSNLDTAYEAGFDAGFTKGKNTPPPQLVQMRRAGDQQQTQEQPTRSTLRPVGRQD